MKYKHIGILILLMACVLSSCAQPSGSISGSRDGTNVELFYVIAIKDEIYLGTIQEPERGRFYRRSDHLKILGAAIDDDINVKIFIINDPLSVNTPPLNVPLAHKGFHDFDKPGHYLVQGTYKGKQDEYPIIVHDSDQGGGGGSSGVIIEWLP